MLGRLRLTVDEATKHYCQLSGKVFSERKWKGQNGIFKATNLENCIKTIVTSSGLEQSSEERMLDTRTETRNEGCKT
jgi:hypothetical protein